MQQITDGIADAFYLASFAVAQAEKTDDPVFTKYSSPAHRPSAPAIRAASTPQEEEQILPA
jgi:hypothetical protein